MGRLSGMWAGLVLTLFIGGTAGAVEGALQGPGSSDPTRNPPNCGWFSLGAPCPAIVQRDPAIPTYPRAHIKPRDGSKPNT